jgi:hypothetical protein
MKGYGGVLLKYTFISVYISLNCTMKYMLIVYTNIHHSNLCKQDTIGCPFNDYVSTVRVLHLIIFSIMSDWWPWLCFAERLVPARHGSYLLEMFKLLFSHILARLIILESFSLLCLHLMVNNLFHISVSVFRATYTINFNSKYNV